VENQLVPNSRRGTRGAALLTIGGVAALENVVSLEWSFPYCNRQEDGPASAVFGLPFPYERWSGATSLQYEFMPHLYALNLVLWLCLAWPLFRVLTRTRAVHRLRLVIVGALLCAAIVVWKTLVLVEGAWQPVRSITHAPYDAYGELRPVGIALGRHYECTPSAFWFGTVQGSSAAYHSGAAQQ
jgi:hypothetical protein